MSRLSTLNIRPTWTTNKYGNDKRLVLPETIPSLQARGFIILSEVQDGEIVEVDYTDQQFGYHYQLGSRVTIPYDFANIDREPVRYNLPVVRRRI